MSFVRDTYDPKFVLGFVLVMAIGGLAWMLAPRLSVSTVVRYANAPATIPVYVRVQPEPDDRWLDVVADGPKWHLTGIKLAGEDSPKIHPVRFEGLPGGCYVFSAYIRAVDEDGPILASAHSWPVSIHGMGLEGDPCG